MSERFISTSQLFFLYIVAAVVRLGIFSTWPALAEALLARPELSTPISAHKRLREGLFLYQRGLDPYAGGTFHQAPLLLPLYSLLGTSKVNSLLLNTACDVVAAHCLVLIATSKAATSSSTYISNRSARSWSPVSNAAIYLFNPFTLAACLAQSTSAFTNAFVLLSIAYACEADTLRAAFASALSTYLGLHPLLIVPAVGMLCHDQNARFKKQNSVLHFATIFISALAVLLLVSRAMLPSWQFLSSVYLTPLTLPDLSPNSGLWWYFFIEMFDTFRKFFLAVFWLHMLAYSVPVCIRMRNQPLAAVCAIYGAIIIFQPYANAADAGAWLALLSCFGHTFELSSAHRHTFAATATLMYAALLGPAFHHLWITAGSGNANFFYAITLVWTLALLILLTDFIYAVLRDQWEVTRKDVAWKDARQI